MVGIFSLSTPVPSRAPDDHPDDLTVCLRARPHGPPTTGPPAPGARWATNDELDGMQLHDSTRAVIRHGLECRPDPFVDERARAQAAGYRNSRSVFYLARRGAKRLARTLRMPTSIHHRPSHPGT
jgi:hypothetical protein